MASGSVSVRLSDEVLEKLTERATTENKKVSDFVRDLIMSELTREPNQGSASVEVLERLGKLDEQLGRLLKKAPAEGLTGVENRLSKLVIKAIKAAAAGQFYARAGALEAVDLVSIWSSQIGAPENTEARKESAGRLDADGQEFADWWIKSG